MLWKRKNPKTCPGKERGSVYIAYKKKIEKNENSGADRVRRNSATQ